jgi:transcription antitermination factor NusA-like protein
LPFFYFFFTHKSVFFFLDKQKKIPSLTTPFLFQAQNNMTTTTLRALVTNRQASIIIGKAGVNVNTIREATEVDVTIQKGSEYERVMILEGEKGSIMSALTRIVQHMQEENKAAPSIELRLLIDKQFVGAIIGTGGKTIHSIQESTGCKVHIDQALLSFSTEKVCKIVGKQAEQISAAVGEILDVITNCTKTMNTVYYEPSRVMRPPPQAHFPFQRRFEPFLLPPLHFPTTEEIQEKVVVPHKYVGRLIGKGGVMINTLQAKTQTQIQLSGQKEEEDQIATIKGFQKENVQWAVHSIRALIKCDE